MTDPRYSLANERTFLAYERTAVGRLGAAGGGRKQRRGGWGGRLWGGPRRHGGGGPAEVRAKPPDQAPS
ncbi:DUF202 domain-containing protein [Microbacterium sp.]|uniref:DUF202 domain-containing protein n=1 Tax=Microbacterium sp. TaxID=51671 RepID=UPI0035AF975A